jgi:hypothetical protein
MGRDITIINAVRATWASPDLFTPVLDGPLKFQEEFIGGDCAFSNPTREAIKEIYECFGETRQVGSIISLGCGIPFSLPSLTSRIIFSDSERVASELKEQLGGTEVYHRYGIPVTQVPIYSVWTNGVTTRIVGDAMSYLGTHSRELDGCILKVVDVTTKDICMGIFWCYVTSAYIALRPIPRGFSGDDWQLSTSALPLLCGTRRHQESNGWSLD